MPVFSKISGTWRTVSQTSSKISGVWRNSQPSVKISGVWRGAATEINANNVTFIEFRLIETSFGTGSASNQYVSVSALTFRASQSQKPSSSTRQYYSWGAMIPIFECTDGKRYVISNVYVAGQGYFYPDVYYSSINAYGTDKIPYDSGIYMDMLVDISSGTIHPNEAAAVGYVGIYGPGQMIIKRVGSDNGTTWRSLSDWDSSGGAGHMSTWASQESGSGHSGSSSGRVRIDGITKNGGQWGYDNISWAFVNNLPLTGYDTTYSEFY